MSVRRALRAIADKSRSSRHLVWAVLDQAALSLANLGLAVLMARVASPHDYGLFVLVSSIWVLPLTALQIPFVMTPLIFVGARKTGDELRRYVQATALLHLAVAAGSVAVLVLVAVLLYPLGAAEYAYATLVATPVVPLVSARYFVRCYHMMRNRVDRAARSDGLVLCVLALGCAWLVLMGRLSLESAVLALCVSESCAVLWFCGSSRRRIAVTMRWWMRSSRADVRQALRAAAGTNWSFGKWLLGTAIAAYILLRGQFLVLPVFAPLTDVAEYHAHYLLLQPVMFLSTAIEGYAWTSGSARYRANGAVPLRAFLRRLASATTLLAVVYSIVALAITPWLLNLILSGPVDPNRGIVTSFGLTSILILWAKLLGTATMLEDSTRTLFVSNAIGAAVSAALSLALIPWVGLIGAALSYTAGFAVTTAYLLRTDVLR